MAGMALSLGRRGSCRAERREGRITEGWRAERILTRSFLLADHGAWYRHLVAAALQERINLAPLFTGQMEIAFGHFPSARFAVPRKDSLHLTARKPAYTTRQSLTVSLKGARSARIAFGD
jgi:hypothetical protein